MPLKAGVAYVDILPNVQRTTFGRELEKQLDSPLRSAEDRFTSVGRKAGQLADRMKYVSIGIGAALLGAGEAASDLNETVSFTEVTFKSAADEMVAWGDTTLETMGIAKASALDSANQFGGLFQVMGQGPKAAAELSQEMVQLAVDMSSAKNVPLDEAVLALGSGLRGEAEPLRRFNVLLSDAAIQAYAAKNGIGAKNAELTEAEKVEARLGLIMEQTTDIQGDYARTAGSSANQQRKATEAAKEAAAEFGQKLAPIMAKVYGLAADIATGFANLPSSVQTGVLALMGVTVALPGILKVVQAVSTLRLAVTGLSIAQGAGGAPLTALGVGLLNVGQSLGVTAGGFATMAAGAAATGGVVLAAAGTYKLLKWEIDQVRFAHEEEQKLMATSVPFIEAYAEATEAGAHSRSELVVAIEREIAWLRDEGASEEEVTAARKAGESALKRYDEAKKSVVKTGGEFVLVTERGKRAIAEFAELSGKELREWRAGTVGNFNIVDDALGELAQKHKVTADAILKHLRRALEAQLEFGQNWREVIDRGGEKAEEFLKHIQETYGAGAPRVVAALADANEKQFNEIVRIWDRAGDNAEKLAGTAGREFSKISRDVQHLTGDIEGLDDKVEKVDATFRDLSSIGAIKVQLLDDTHTGGPRGGDGGSAASMASWAVARFPGIGITSGYRPGDDGFHGDYSNPAQDLSGPGWPDDESGVFLPQAKRVYDTLASTFGAGIREMIYGRWQWERGREIGYGGDDHWGHVHVADDGGVFENVGNRMGLIGIGPQVREVFASGDLKRRSLTTGPFTVRGGKLKVDLVNSEAYIEEIVLDVVGEEAGFAQSLQRMHR